MYRLMRTATVRNASLLPSALAFASQVTAHVNKAHALNMRFGDEQFGSANIHWHFDADSLDKMQHVNETLLEDRQCNAMLDKFKDTWAEGSMRDSVIRMS